MLILYPISNTRAEYTWVNYIIRITYCTCTRINRGCVTRTCTTCNINTYPASFAVVDSTTCTIRSRTTTEPSFGSYTTCGWVVGSTRCTRYSGYARCCATCRSRSTNKSQPNVFYTCTLPCCSSGKAINDSRVATCADALVTADRACRNVVAVNGSTT